MRVVLVANTESGSAGAAGEAERLLRDGGAQVQEIALGELCDGPGSVDDERLAATARRLGAGTVRRVVVAGGDGSVGPAALLALRAGLPLAVIPAGTANSFARWLDLPLDLEEAARLAADPGASTRPAEVAAADGRPFVNVASTGLAVLAAHGARPLKQTLGPLAYAAGAVKAGATGRPIRTAVSTDGEQAWAGEAWQVAVAASGAFGGESNTGGVDPRDGRLDVAVVEAGPRRSLVRHAWAMSRGRLVREDDVPHVRGRVVELDLPARTAFNVDGEILRLDRARFELLGTLDVVGGPPS